MAMIKNEYALVMGVRSSSGNGKYNAGSKTKFQLDRGLNTLPVSVKQRRKQYFYRSTKEHYYTKHGGQLKK